MELWSDEQEDYRFGCEQEEEDNGPCRIIPPFYDKKVQEFLNNVKERIRAQEFIIQFHGWIITTTHPLSPIDENNTPRDDATIFK